MMTSRLCVEHFFLSLTPLLNQPPLLPSFSHQRPLEVSGALSSKMMAIAAE